jgi:hypothetical protein
MKKFPGYMPRKDGERLLWLKNYQTRLPEIGPLIGFTPERIIREHNRAQRIIDGILGADAAKKEFDHWMAVKKNAYATDLKEIGKTAAAAKVDLNYEKMYGAALGIEGDAREINTDKISPVIKVFVHHKYVRINFRKKYADNVCIYSRIAGTGGKWQLLAKIRVSPYIDLRPVTNGVAENREYMAMCVYKDREVGQPSGIVQVTIPAVLGD